MADYRSICLQLNMKRGLLKRLEKELAQMQISEKPTKNEEPTQLWELFEYAQCYYLDFDDDDDDDFDGVMTEEEIWAEVLAILDKHGDKVNLDFQKTDRYDDYDHCRTMLALVCGGESFNYAVAKKLLELGADPNAGAGSSVPKRQYDLKGDEYFINIVSSPLWSVCDYPRGIKDIVQLLIDAGADVTLEKKDGQTMLHSIVTNRPDTYEDRKDVVRAITALINTGKFDLNRLYKSKTVYDLCEEDDFRECIKSFGGEPANNNQKIE